MGQYKSNNQTLEKEWNGWKIKQTKSCARHKTVYRKMKTRKEFLELQRRKIFEQENEQIMLAVHRQELQEMLRLAEYGY